jgi:hypothetical protein
MYSITTKATASDKLQPMKRNSSLTPKLGPLDGLRGGFTAIAFDIAGRGS